MAGATAREKPDQTGQTIETSKIRRIAFFSNWKIPISESFKFTFPVQVILTSDKKLFVAIKSSLPRYASPLVLSFKLYGPITNAKQIHDLSPFKNFAQTEVEIQNESKKINALDKVRDVTVDLNDFKNHFKEAITAIAAGDEATLRKLCPDPTKNDVESGQDADQLLDDIF